MASLIFPLACYVGLAVAGVEVTAPGYARQAVTLAYCVDAVTISNLASAQWPHATQSWGTIDTVQVWDNATGGRLIGSVPPNVPVLIGQYDIARIPASGFVLTYDTASSPRPYGRGGYGTGFYAAYRTLHAGTFRLRPYGEGPYSSDVFGAYTSGSVELQRDFDQQHVCAPGTWAPGPFSMAA